MIANVMTNPPALLSNSCPGVECVDRWLIRAPFPPLAAAAVRLAGAALWLSTQGGAY
jgi:hypothetical protein